MSKIASSVQPSGPPGRPKMLSHAAFMSSDTAATAAFYSGILGMELVAAVLDDSIPSTGEPIPYFHSFFRMADGSTIAFFEAPELPPPSVDSHPAYATFRHFAMQVETEQDVDQEVEVLGPIDHGIIYSIYFRDPDGHRLEITTPKDASWNDDAAAASESLAQWEAVKELARESGRDLATVLAEHTRERSHRRSQGLKD